MNRQEHLLSCLAEECAEVAQRVSKGLRFGLSEVQSGQPLNNAERIAEELRDLWSVALMLSDEGALALADLWPTGAQTNEKRRKIEKFMAISREQGALTQGGSHGTE